MTIKINVTPKYPTQKEEETTGVDSSPPPIDPPVEDQEVDPRDYSTYEGIGANIGAGGVGRNAQYGMSATDPQAALAQIAQQQYNDYVQQFQQFELEALERSQTDTSLIDQAYEDAPKAAALSQGIQQRNLSRYGQELTPMQQKELSRSNQRTGQLGMINAVSNARLAQRESNQKLLSDLINIGQGLNRSSLSQLGTSAANQAAREQAYSNAKAQSKAQTYSTIGALGALAIMMI